MLAAQEFSIRRSYRKGTDQLTHDARHVISFRTNDVKLDYHVQRTLSLNPFLVLPNRNKEALLKIAIIGAGIAGLSLANLLNRQRPDIDLVLFEKSRGVGGRMATRYTETHSFDHGAQFFTVRTRSFRDFLARHMETGLITAWNANITKITPNEKPGTHTWLEPHYVAQPRMTSLCKNLAIGLDVRLGCSVDTIHQTELGWRLTLNDGQCERFDWVISTAPAEQTTALLPMDFSDVTFDPAFTLMLALENAPDFDGAIVHSDEIEWIAVSSSKPGRDTKPSLVAHSSGQYAMRRFDDDRDDIGVELTNRLFELTGIKSQNRQLHRWKYAKVTTPWHSPIFFDPENTLAACGDWMIGGRIEDAFTSAEILARKLLAQLQ